MTVDILAIGAHPDDVELAMAGSLLAFASLGRRVAVVDLTRGELGSRGSTELRAREASAATEILRLAARENLDLPDGSVRDDRESRAAVIRVLRRHRPRLVFTHHPQDHSGHPDHTACSRLVERAVYLSGLAKFDTGQERYRPEAVIFFNLPRRLFPSFIVDVSDVYPQARRALEAYGSQFHDPASDAPATYLSHPRFLQWLESVRRYYGALIGVDYAEAFWCRRPIRLADPIGHFTPGI
ncbi:MAG: bacillithiol biosynthesis deacetylase BshB1 [Acidobacteria bacterium]|nr:bacillithiol biosynthesis deacetylase BshB1 [Acidobacteriota bacterium]